MKNRHILTSSEKLQPSEIQLSSHEFHAVFISAQLEVCLFHQSHMLWPSKPRVVMTLTAGHGFADFYSLFNNKESLLLLIVRDWILGTSLGGGLGTAEGLRLTYPQAIRHPSNFRVVQSKFRKSGNLVHLNIVHITCLEYSQCSNYLQSFNRFLCPSVFAPA